MKKSLSILVLVLLIVFFTSCDAAPKLQVAGTYPGWYSSSTWKESINIFAPNGFNNVLFGINIPPFENTYKAGSSLESNCKGKIFELYNIEEGKITIGNSAMFTLELVADMRIEQTQYGVAIKIGYMKAGDEGTTISGSGVVYNANGVQVGSFIVTGNGSKVE